ELAELEDRARRRDIVVDDEAVHAFYDARLPADVVSARHFDKRWKQARKEQPDLLMLKPEDLLAGSVAEDDYPTTWRHGDLDLGLTYRFEPGAPDAGVTVNVPLTVLPQLRPSAF